MSASGGSRIEEWRWGGGRIVCLRRLDRNDRELGRDLADSGEGLWVRGCVEVGLRGRGVKPEEARGGDGGYLIFLACSASSPVFPVLRLSRQWEISNQSMLFSDFLFEICFTVSFMS